MRMEYKECILRTVITVLYSKTFRKAKNKDSYFYMKTDLTQIDQLTVFMVVERENK